ncbi:MAG TPA: DUF2235 domain-containing protein [Blastocatellia bacterium]|nr:DUF2235 domain-containing protein [Blastocatellia bacterium]
MKRLVILFDGTWNTPKSSTNVYRFSQCVKPQDSFGIPQVSFYDPGVGTSWGQRLSGGILGVGLSQNIRQGYQWLSERYEAGDEVFVFGFSRGAYTARSLVGLVRKCGVLQPDKIHQVQSAYELYRRKEVHPDAAEAVNFRSANSCEIRVKFIGVWDTVGALGLPSSYVPFGRNFFTWHDTELSKIVDYAYHALAIDEHREDFAPAVWTGKVKPENKHVEQRWFIGAHSNVGGGNPNDPLPNIALRWLQRAAVACDLEITGEIEVSNDVYLAEVDDSFKKFMFGIYRFFKFGKRYYRKMGSGINEVIDDSVTNRYQAKADYRPPSYDSYLVAQKAKAASNLA